MLWIYIQWCNKKIFARNIGYTFVYAMNFTMEETKNDA